MLQLTDIRMVLYNRCLTMHTFLQEEHLESSVKSYTSHFTQIMQIMLGSKHFSPVIKEKRMLFLFSLRLDSKGKLLLKAPLTASSRCEGLQQEIKFRDSAIKSLQEEVDKMSQVRKI